MPVVGRGKIDEAARVHRCNWERGRVVASCSGTTGGFAELWASLTLDRSRGHGEILVRSKTAWPKWAMSRAEISRLNTVAPIVTRTD